VAEAGPGDVHVDLGSGDGRLCFQAIDYGVDRSTGIDVDEVITAAAQNRLMRRHPPPPLEFIVADLLDVTHPAWEKVQEATLITMYFADEALRVFRPVLEEKLAGRECKILTCGYEMPGWNSRMQEVVLGTKIHRYDWGSEEPDYLFFNGDDMLEGIGQEFLNRQPNKEETEDKFPGYKIVDYTLTQESGFIPEDNDHDLDSDDEEEWGKVYTVHDDFRDDDDEEEEEENDEDEVVVNKKKGCSKT